MYLLLKLLIFHCHVSFRGCTWTGGYCQLLQWLARCFFPHTKKETEDSVYPRWWIFSFTGAMCCWFLNVVSWCILCNFLAMLHGSWVQLIRQTSLNSRFDSLKQWLVGSQYWWFTIPGPKSYFGNLCDMPRGLVKHNIHCLSNWKTVF